MRNRCYGPQQNERKNPVVGPPSARPIRRPSLLQAPQNGGSSDRGRPHPTARMTGRLGRWRRDHHVKGPSAPPRRFRARLASSTSPRAVSHSCSESRARPEVDRRKITHPPAAPPVSIYSPVVSNNCRAMGGEERPASRVVVRSSTWSGKATPQDVQ